MTDPRQVERCLKTSSAQQRAATLVSLLLLPALWYFPTVSATAQVTTASPSARTATDPVVIDVIDVQQLVHDDGHAYRYPLPGALRVFKDDSQENRSSRLGILEDGKPLSRPHAAHAAIRRTGSGRFSHWGIWLYFAASDNTDPRTNGRRYEITLGGPVDREFVDPVTHGPPVMVETLPGPTIAIPGDSAWAGGYLKLRVDQPDPELLYYWEVDLEPTFDSIALHRQPPVGISARGPDPLTMILRNPDFGPQLKMPYRIGALAPFTEVTDEDNVRQLALRLGYGLTGDAQVREVWEYVRYQFYPRDPELLMRTPEETLRLDRGLCGGVNSLALTLLDDLGFATRLVWVRVPRFAPLYDKGSGSHISAEVNSDGSWSIVDPWLDVYLPGVSYSSVAAGNQAAGMQVLQYLCSDPEAFSDAGLTPEDQWVTLGDFASRRTYVSIDPEVPPRDAGDLSDEAHFFFDHPRTVPIPLFDELWPEPTLDVYMRVRGLATSPDVMAPRFFGDGQKQRPSAVRATPWTTVRLTIDLRRAYGATALTDADSANMAPTGP